MRTTKETVNALLPTAAPGPLGRTGTAGDTPPRRLLLEAALRLFCRNGIRATGIDAILAESGVARMTMYNHFGSKDGLVVAALEHEGAAWRNWFFTRLASIPGGPRERLAGIFDVLEEWFARDDYFGCALMNAIIESRGNAPEIRNVVADHKSQVMAQIRALASAAGNPNPQVLSEQIDLLIDGAIVKAMVKREPKAAREAKDILKQLLPAA